MAVPYDSVGRTRQKARTRDALIAATRQQLADGHVPTMEGAAAGAGISRTTAYRYFLNVRELLAASLPHVEHQSALGPHPPSDVRERLAIVVAGHTDRILRNEPQMRAVLRLSLQGVRPAELPMHSGARVEWITEALEPLRGRLPDDALRRLVLGICATIGIESFVWLTDVAGLSHEHAVETIQDNARGLLQAALVQHGV